MHIYCRYVWKVKYLYSVQMWESLSSFIFKTIKLLTDPWKKNITALCLLVNLHHKNWSVGISHSVTYCIQFHSYYCKPISATWVCISAMLSKWRQISSITCYARGTASRGACPQGEKKRAQTFNENTVLYNSIWWPRDFLSSHFKLNWQPCNVQPIWVFVCRVSLVLNQFAQKINTTFRGTACIGPSFKGWALISCWKMLFPEQNLTLAWFIHV